jgi:hypothetical protein
MEKELIKSLVDELAENRNLDTQITTDAEDR